MAEAIAEVTGKDVRCKWPNDLLLDDAKVGGVLLEAGVDDGVLRHVVVGVGVNLSAPAGVAGAGAVGARADAAAISDRLPPKVRGGLPRATRAPRAPALPGSGGTPRSAAWSARPRRRGRRSSARRRASHEDGALQLWTADGVVEVGFGEIEHLRPAVTVFARPMRPR